MKKLSAILLIASLPFLLTSCSLKPKTVEKTPPKTQATQTPTASVAGVLSAEEKSLETLYKASRVIDGDTFELIGGQKVRLIGIDAPEVIDCFALKSTNRLKELVMDKALKLEKDVSETDRYGRLLRYVYLESQLVNEVLVKEGYAVSYVYPPDVKFQEKIKTAENQAKNQNLGLWGECKTSTPAVQTPKSSAIQEKKETASQPPSPTPPPPAAAPQNTNTAPTPDPTPPPVVSHTYYTSSYRTAKYYYCDTDPGWKSLKAQYLRSFNSIEDLLKEFSNRKPHQDPIC